MTSDQENAMYRAIEDFRDEQKCEHPKSQRELPTPLSDDWHEKYDHLYRELKPREWFGKTFSHQYRRVA